MTYIVPSFIVKNNTKLPGRVIRIYNTPIYPGRTLDIMKILNVSEDTIRKDLCNGDLGNKIRNGQLLVISSTVGIPETDCNLMDSLCSAGLSNNIIGNTASGVFYTPTIPADWDSLVPTTVQQALDNLAEINTMMPSVTQIVYVAKGGDDALLDADILPEDTQDWEW